MSSPSSPAPGGPASPSFTITSPADILSYIPHALGFMPAESLVVLTTTGTRLGATLRVDLPAQGADPLAFAEGVVSFLRGDPEADGTLVVVYTREEWHRLRPPPHEDLLDDLEMALKLEGFPVRAGWLVSGSGWRDYFCRDERCCPWPGTPLDAVVHSALNAELIFGGSAFDASAPEAVLRAAPAVAPRDGWSANPGAVEDAQAHFAARCAGRWISQGQFTATSALWDVVLSRPGTFHVQAEPEVAGFLLASIECRTVRDFLLASACLGSTAALDGARACGLLDPDALGPGPEPGPLDPGQTPDRPEPGAAAWAVPAVRGIAVSPVALRQALEVARAAVTAADPTAPTAASTDASAAAPTTAPAAAVPTAAAVAASTATVERSGGRGQGADAALLYADLLAGRFPGPIAWERVDAMSEVLARLAAVSDGESRAAALTMSAWFEYARGRGSRAAVFLGAAEQAVPGYRLARLLSELLRRGGLPAWARRRSTAWTTGGAPSSGGAT